MGAGTRRKIRARRDPRGTADRRRARLHREGRCGRARARAPPITTGSRPTTSGRRSAARKTLPADNVSRVRLGVVSCSNLPQGYFNAYACLANRDVDAVLHLGDYFYEYPNKQYGDGTALGRIPAPDKEIVSLQEYRERHAQYKADPDSQEVHRQHPFIVTWDDHEFANNTWWGGAENHTPATEGDWSPGAPRRCSPTYEWMPIREDPQTLTPRIYRTFRFGDLATLFMLDTRLVGRDQEVDREDLAALASPSRSLLGAGAGELAGASSLSISAQQHDVERARAAGDVRAADRRLAPRSGKRRFLGRLSRVARARVRHDRARQGQQPRRADRRRSQLVGLRSAAAIRSTATTRRPARARSVSNSPAHRSARRATSAPGRMARKQLADIMANRPHLHYVDGRYRGYFILDLTQRAAAGRLLRRGHGAGAKHEGTLREGIHHGIRPKPSD